MTGCSKELLSDTLHHFNIQLALKVGRLAAVAEASILGNHAAFLAPLA